MIPFDSLFSPRARLRTLVSAFAFGALSACGGKSGADTNDCAVTTPTPCGGTAALQGELSVVPVSAQLNVGQTVTLVTTVTTAGSGVSVSYAYATDNAAVSTVSASGVIAAVSAGLANVTVTATGSGTGFTSKVLSRSIAVQVVQLPNALTEFSVSAAASTVTAGQVVQLTPLAKAAGTSVAVTVTYESSNTAVATVSATGAVTGVTASATPVTITATARGSGAGFSTNTLSAVATITVIPQANALASFAVTPPLIVLRVGETRQLPVNAVTSAPSVNVSYAISNQTAPAVASINGSLLITAVAPGTSTVTVTATGSGSGYVTNQISVPVTIEVAPLVPAVTAFSIAPLTSNLALGGTVTLIPTVTQEPGANVILTYASSNTAVATVNASGVVAAVTPGSATIFATAAGSGLGFSAAALTATASVAVARPPEALSDASYTTPTACILLGQTFNLNPVAVKASSAVSVAFGYVSSNTTVATVSASGIVTAVASGATAITATATGTGSGYSTTVIPKTIAVAVCSPTDAITAVTLNPASNSVAAGGSVTLRLNSTGPAVNPILDATFSSSNSAIATVNASGVVNAIAPGTATISASVTGSAPGYVARTLPASTTVQVTAPQWASVAAGERHTCALTVAGKAYCWGSNSSNQLGDGTSTDRVNPTPVSTALTFSALTAGALHTCGLSAGAIYCWGSSIYGQVGDGATIVRSRPTAITSSSLIFSAVDAGAYHTCGLTTTGAAYCWGYNGVFQLGDLTTVNRTTPVRVGSSLFSFSQISVGDYHACGVTTSGPLWCWGDNSQYQLGNLGDAAHISPVATYRLGPLVYTDVFAGSLNACMRTDHGFVYCWGPGNLGQLGTTGQFSIDHPSVPVYGGFNFTSVAIGSTHMCGRLASGVTYCWGNNANGALGLGASGDVSRPTAVRGPAFAQIAAGGAHTCGVADAAIYCWGLGTSGQIGNGLKITQGLPQLVTFSTLAPIRQ